MAEKLSAGLTVEASLSAQDFVAAGDRLFQEKQWSAAFANYKRAIAIQPELPLVLCKLGKVSLRQSQWDEAKRWFVQALALNPQSHLANYGLARVAMGRQDWAAAVEPLNRTIELKPSFVTAVYVDLGKALQQLHRWDDAIAAYCTVLQYAADSEIYDQLAITLCDQARAQATAKP